MDFAQSALQYQSVLAELEEYPLLRPYQVFASGIGKDDTSTYMALVLVHRDSEDADENVELFEERMQRAKSIAQADLQ